MPLPTVDMQNSCCKKQRCLFGPNEGQVYDICDPCQGQGDFDEATCDCISDVSKSWLISYTTYTGGNYGCTYQDFTCGDGAVKDETIRTVTLNSPYWLAYTGNMNFGSLGTYCSYVTEEVNCGMTVQEITGQDFVINDFYWNPQDASQDIFECGLSDWAWAFFTATDHEDNGAMAGSTYAQFVSAGTGGPIGCIVPIIEIVSVTPITD